MAWLVTNVASSGTIMVAEHPVETKLREHWPPGVWRDVTVIVAVSGGGDSVALLRALLSLRQGGPGRLCVAHFHHGLRESAESDAEFVVRLAQRHGLHVELGRAAGKGSQPLGPQPLGPQSLGPQSLGPQPGSLEGDEGASRRRRYAFLRQAAAKLGARYVATAHTADDQEETILHRIVRGTGLNGLAGIPRLRPLDSHCVLVRPCLDFRRSELRQYLADIGQEFREDPTNAERRFTRNRIRHELLPELARHYNPRVGEALRRLGRLASEAQELIEPLVNRLLDEALDRDPAAGGDPGPEKAGTSFRIRRSALADQPRYLVREVLIEVWTRQGLPRRGMGFEQWDLLADFLLGKLDASSRHFPGGIWVEREPEAIVVHVPSGSGDAGRTGDGT